MEKPRLTIVVNMNTPQARETFSSLGKVIALDSHEVTRDAIAHADVLIVRSETRVDKHLLHGTSVRFVGTVSIGTDHIDESYLKEQGIGFASAPGSNANSVAEYVAASLMEWSKRTGQSLPGKTIGVVGVGNCGTKVARIARVLGMTPILNDPPLARQSGDPSYRPLDELMDADVVTLHVPLTSTGEDPTYHLFGGQRLSKLKPGSLLINTARGGVVDTTALVRHLSSGRGAAAVIDVWEHEPLVDADLVERAMIATPHIAGHSLDGKLNALLMVFDATCRYFRISSATAHLDYSVGGLEIPVPDSVPPFEDHLVRYVTEKAYDIVADDTALRAIGTVPEVKRGEYFAALRASYRVRREFHNWIVTLGPAQKKAERLLGDLGFRVGYTDT